jgi:transposase
VTSALGDLPKQLGPFYSDIGRPSIDPELLVRMLKVGFCYGIRSERRLCEEVGSLADRGLVTQSRGSP